MYFPFCVRAIYFAPILRCCIIFFGAACAEYLLPTFANGVLFFFDIICSNPACSFFFLPIKDLLFLVLFLVPQKSLHSALSMEGDFVRFAPRIPFRHCFGFLLFYSSAYVLPGAVRASAVLKFCRNPPYYPRIFLIQASYSTSVSSCSIST